MPEQTDKDSWIAGLKEYRVALAVAGIATVAIAVLLTLSPDTAVESNPDTAKHQPSSSPLYAVPHRDESASVAKKIEKVPSQPPAFKTITPETRIEPVSRQVKKRKIQVKKKISSVKKHAPESQPGKTKQKKNGPSLTGNKTIFFVQTGAYRELTSARKQAAILMQKGWNSALTRNAKGLHIVRVGPVANRSAAKMLLRQLKSKAQLSGFIVQVGQ